MKTTPTRMLRENGQIIRNSRRKKGGKKKKIWTMGGRSRNRRWNGKERNELKKNEERKKQGRHRNDCFGLSGRGPFWEGSTVKWAVFRCFPLPVHANGGRCHTGGVKAPTGFSWRCSWCSEDNALFFYAKLFMARVPWISVLPVQKRHAAKSTPSLMLRRKRL